MKKAIIIYQSKKGTTRKLGEEIQSVLTSKLIATDIQALEECKGLDVSAYDYVFLGCWTKGLMFFAQHPDKVWNDYVPSLRFSKDSKMVFFTSYKIATGSMFSQMKKSLPQEHPSIYGKIKSRDGNLNYSSAELLNWL